VSLVSHEAEETVENESICYQVVLCIALIAAVYRWMAQFLVAMSYFAG